MVGAVPPCPPHSTGRGNHCRSEGDSVSDSGRSVSEQAGRSPEIAPTIHRGVFDFDQKLVINDSPYHLLVVLSNLK